MTLLKFDSPASGATLPARLVFAGPDDDTDPGTGGNATISLTAVVTGLAAAVVLAAGVVCSVEAAVTGLAGNATVQYDSNTSRPTVGQAGQHWQDAAQIQSGAVGVYQQAAPLVSGAVVHWQQAQPVSEGVDVLWEDCGRIALGLRSAYQQAHQVATLPLVQRYQDGLRLRTAALQRFQQAVALPVVPVHALFEDARRLRTASSQRFQEAQRTGVQAVSDMTIALQVWTTWAGRFQDAWPPRPGRWPGLPPVHPEPDPCYLPELPVRLVFEAPGTGGVLPPLVFICERHNGPGPEPGATVVVPVRRIYMTINNVSLMRVDGAVPIPAYSFGMSLDVDSWTWGWQATLHADALPLIQPEAGGDPVDVLATVNGVPYRLLAESYSRQRQFGNTRISVKGRGRAAILDAPYAPVLNHGNTAARTAQQLMADVLTVNGVGIGWDVDWNLTDWLVPGNVWANQGSYISALQDIAQAVGGYLQPHDTAQTLRVLHRYPTAPWEWATALTPDYELPSAVVAVEGIDWQRMATYDRVFVEGVKAGAGVRGQVTRAGTAGGLLAPMVVHPLITHADAARQRGVSELSNSGSQARISLRLPVLAETGVIKPGALVRYVDGADTHLGLVRSTSVEWALPTLRQVLTVETHLAE